MTDESPRAFVPGHVTGFFSVHEADDPERAGSRGAGMTLSEGATVELEPADETTMQLNDEPAAFDAVTRVLDALDAEARVTVRTDPPVGAGFGVSGAAALAANRVFERGRSENELITIAHAAESRPGPASATWSRRPAAASRSDWTPARPSTTGWTACPPGPASSISPSGSARPLRCCRATPGTSRRSAWTRSSASRRRRRSRAPGCRATPAGRPPSPLGQRERRGARPRRNHGTGGGGRGGRRGEPVQPHPRARGGHRRPLRDHGASAVKGLKADARIPGLDHERAKVDGDGIYAADAVVVPLEDGDRAEALAEMGKTEIAVDLNPLSRSARTAAIPIVDNIVRAVPNVTKHARELQGTSRGELEAIVAEFDREAALAAAERAIREGDLD